MDTVDVAREMEKQAHRPPWPVPPVWPIVPFPVRHPPYPHCIVTSSTLLYFTYHIDQGDGEEQRQADVLGTEHHRQPLSIGL